MKQTGKTPISLIIDDSTPCVQVFYYHMPNHVTSAGTVIRRDVAPDFLDEFCDVVSETGMKGKFSVIPEPGNLGNLVDGLEGYTMDEINVWLETVKGRLAGRFSFGPEMLTHHLAVDPFTHETLDMNEMDWAAKQTEYEPVKRYINAAAASLARTGIIPSGVTSPWSFGKEIEGMYARAVGDAMNDLFGRKHSWYFLHTKAGVPNAAPTIAYRDGDIRVVSIPATTHDMLWRTIDMPVDGLDPEAYAEKAGSLADLILTADGKRGSVADALEIGAAPVILEHWQSLWSNGSRLGLRALRIAAKRIRETLSDRVEWMDFEELTELFAD